MPAPKISDHPAARPPGEAVSLPSGSAPGKPKPKAKCNCQAVEALLRQQKTVVEIIARVQSEFIATTDKQATWNGLLSDILCITASQYGLIGQVLRSDQGQPYLKTVSLTDIAWNAQTRAQYQAQAGQGLEFHNLHNLLGTVLRNGQMVMANNASRDPRRGGLPPGHPPLADFLGLPIHHDGELLAMVGIANRAGGYDTGVVELLQPLLRTIGQLIVAARTATVLATERQRLAYVLAATGDGIWDWDIASRRISHNPQWARLVGYDPDQTTHPYDFIDQWIHPDDRPHALAQLQIALDGSDSFQVEYRFLRPDGQTIWLHDRGRVVERDALGHPLRMVGAIMDITQRKVAEAHLELAASVFMHAREGIAITDAAGCIIDVNETFCTITGYAHDEVIGQNPAILNSGRQDRAFYAQMWQLLKTEGFWSGEIWNRRKGGEVYPELLTISAVRDASGQTQKYVAIFSDLTTQKENERRLAHIVHFDTLTGLPNRVRLTERLSHAMTLARRSQRQLALAFMDMDGFKAINDRHGLEAGDAVLVTIAGRLHDVLCDDDTLARFGGDEFVAVMPDLPGQAYCLVLVERLLAALSQPITLSDGQVLQVSGSIGLTFFPQKEDIDADQLLRQADLAMYQAKLAGKNRYAVFDIDRHHSLRGQHEQLGRIRQALMQSEFVLFYQPKVNMRSGAVIGVEALIRWQHPQHGLLAPVDFLPFIAQHALEIDVGRWVMAAALRQMADWQACGLNLPVSVNIAGYHLQQPDFFAELQALLAQHPQVPAHLLELEVLESSAFDDMAHVSGLIEACGRIGVGFSLDDFGTGYSSLTYLKRLPAHTLKIDQSFVRDMLHDPDDLAILEGILGLARAFRRTVIAEGVETVAHGQQLLQLGCELAQGYGIAHPMPGAQIPHWAARWQPPALWSRTRCAQTEDLPLIYAVVEHRAWMRDMLACLAGVSATQRPTLDPCQCHFGQWLDTRRNEVGLQEINQIHVQLHTAGVALLSDPGTKANLACSLQWLQLQAIGEQLIDRLHRLLNQA